MTSPAPLTYDERLTAPRTWWLIAVAVGFSMALIVMPYGGLAALGGLAVGTLIACMWVSAQGSSRIRVTSDLLVADDARIPLSALGEVHVLEGQTGPRGLAMPPWPTQRRFRHQVTDLRKLRH
ncbi:MULTISPECIES: DUF3093 family protein [unclassified Streptomyces]|uniref:DUF3093 family protein n=1 Tax=unclassified Streptomyces TaxID=2593676 RepID=UPI000DC7DCF4|nr:MULTISPECIES: DUF3093 family protein [unclassified Streptomyces]AWZ05318.1 hypothetical protein DRB89_12320 [Streptomyces sp. ICC4]AWZ11434.1 hypothetical protein DRB96_02880 [Streptomyces sp. ICC1]